MKQVALDKADLVTSGMRDADPGPASQSEEGPERRSGNSAAGAADASPGVRGLSSATSHGGKSCLFSFPSAEGLQ